MPVFAQRLSAAARSVRPAYIRPQAPRTAVRSITASTTASASHPPEGSHVGGSVGHDAHHDHYDPPGGWLWGIRPGEKYEKEGWEDIFIYGFGGCFLVAGSAYVFKEDTS